MIVGVHAEKFNDKISLHVHLQRCREVDVGAHFSHVLRTWIMLPLIYFA